MVALGWSNKVIRLIGISKSFGDKVLLRGVGFHFTNGERYGLVGANGAGKTTLLNIITGDEEADDGEVIKPRGCRLAHLPQAPNPTPLPTVLEECMTGDLERNNLRLEVAGLGDLLALDHTQELQDRFENAEGRARHMGSHLLEGQALSLLSGLGFDADAATRNPLTFSGGWRMRIELARILIGRPDFLVLDEPTNHLDLPTIAWLEDRLRSFAGCLLYVSHDRSLLNRLSTQILHLRGGNMADYPGGFDHFLEESAKREEERERRAERIAAEAERLEDFARRFGAKSSLASRARSKLRMAGRLRALESDLVSDDSAGDASSIVIRIPEAPPSARVVLKCEGLLFGHSRALAEPFDCVVERGMRVAVIGANGAGKTTLVRTLVGSQDVLGGSCQIGKDVVLSYFAQEQSEVLDPRASALQTLLDASPGLDARAARSLLGALRFSGDEVNKPVGVLSGGEKNRIGLACLLAGRANLLVLDEPTNHLDMSSVELLAMALCSFSGTMIFVSHNRDFVDDVCTHILAVTRQGQIGLFEGKLEDYSRACKRMGFPDVLAIEPDQASKPVSGKALHVSSQTAVAASSADRRPSGARENRAEKTRLRREIDRVESRLEELAALRSRLEQELTEVDPADYRDAQRRASDLATLVQEITDAEEKWLSLHERMESVDMGTSVPGT